MSVGPFPRNPRWATWVAAFTLLMLSACSGGGDTPAGDTSQPSPPSQEIGGRIAFGRFDDALGDFLLFTADPDGSNVEPLLPGAAECPRWAPDGSSTLLVCVANPDGLLRPATVQADGSGFELLDNPDPTLNIACWGWTPDGTRLVCESWDEKHPARNGIYSVRARDGGDLRRLTVTPEGGSAVLGGYSPDGSQIVFTGSKPGDPGLCAVFVMDADGTHEHEITPFGTIGCGSPAWSPAGDEILVADGRLAVMHPNGTGLRWISLTQLQGNPSAFAANWSPDGATVLFSLSLGVKADLYSIGLDGSDLRQVTNTPDVEEDLADWGTVTKDRVSPG